MIVFDMLENLKKSYVLCVIMTSLSIIKSKFKKNDKQMNENKYKNYLRQLRNNFYFNLSKIENVLYFG